MPAGRPKGPPAPPRTNIHVVLDTDLLDALDVECEIATVGRALAIREGIEWWIERQRTNPKWKA